jgi:hypothetical protein
MSKKENKPKKVSITNIVNWITSHIWQSVLIALALFLVPLVIVHFLYKWYTGVWILASTWSSGDLITYIAGFEAFLGTVVLSAVALHQNDKSNAISERVLKLEEDSCFFSHFPNIVIVGDGVLRATFSEHVNTASLIYTFEENFDLVKDLARVRDQYYFIIRFAIRNLSNFNVRIKLASLYIEGILHEENAFEYKSNPINFRPKKAVIAPNEKLGVGFLVNDTSLIREDVFSGVMHILVYNNLNEAYHYTLEFKASIDDKSSGLFVLDQYDGKLVEQEY